jgi:hypothetical protein
MSYSGNNFLRKQNMRDILFLNEIYKVTTDEEIQEIIKLIDLSNLDFNQRQQVELFFLKLKNIIGTWYDMLVGMMEYFDLDVINVLKNTSMLEKCKAEKFAENKVNIMELFG